MTLKEQVKDRMDRLGLRRWTCGRNPAEWDDETTCSRSFRSDNSDVYRPHEDEEDDDWPEFVGEAMIQKAAEEHFRDLPVKVFVCDQEKGWFTVAVELKDEKAPTAVVPVPAPVTTPAPAPVVQEAMIQKVAPSPAKAKVAQPARRLLARKPRSRRKGLTSVSLKQRTLDAIQRARDEKHMTWEAIEERFNLRRSNGMTAYRAYHKA